MRTACFALLCFATLATAQTTRPDERETSLSHVTQLTSGFARAGEAYFSPDMKHVIFQASKEKDAQYQMYVAAVKWEGDRLAGLEEPKRISAENSRNTCG